MATFNLEQKKREGLFIRQRRCCRTASRRGGGGDGRQDWSRSFALRSASFERVSRGNGAAYHFEW